MRMVGDAILLGPHPEVPARSDGLEGRVPDVQSQIVTPYFSRSARIFSALVKSSAFHPAARAASTLAGNVEEQRRFRLKIERLRVMRVDRRVGLDQADIAGDGHAAALLQDGEALLRSRNVSGAKLVSSVTSWPRASSARRTATLFDIRARSSGASSCGRRGSGPPCRDGGRSPPPPRPPASAAVLLHVPAFEQTSVRNAVRALGVGDQREITLMRVVVDKHASDVEDDVTDISHALSVRLRDAGIGRFDCLFHDARQRLAGKCGRPPVAGRGGGVETDFRALDRAAARNA